MITTFDQYQSEAIKTLRKIPKDCTVDAHKYSLAVTALGIAGEGGEVAEKIKKYIDRDRELDMDDMRKEIGDVMWYIAAMCDLLGITMGECADLNIKKLRARHGADGGWTGDGNRTEDVAR
ncbi:MAG: nucleoside triphosphate pyrophosphohydrolase family protein [Firmicutes bacterium]|nr:nucleoside triphosphate pyrophosphohydrolase family protein [Bacillota bacterium]